MADPTRMTLREKRRLETRGLLVSAMSDLLGERGFQSTSIEDITGRAGTSRATFYAYFDSKDAALRAVVEQMWDEVESIYADFGRLPDWSPASIASWLRDFAEAWQLTASRNRGASEALQADIVKDVPARYQALVDSVRQRRELWSHFTEREAEARAKMLILLLQEYLTAHFFEGSDAGIDLVVEQLTSAVRDLLRADG